ncbi:phosphoribosyltransferase family protein [Actinokineospora inagensis]|uniref:phosphoribosyltransferase family protein n=1 Tax=Actinokineospora inagensis TaxID=103730 RepID=UPI00047ECBC0|nr:phosphoribosyltransferase family protein [Actinokineospora inagensis]
MKGKRSSVQDALRREFSWRGNGDEQFADIAGWWRSPALLAQLGSALAGLFSDAAPSVVVGVESRGVLLGPLVALTLGVGFVEVRKDRPQLTDNEAWVRQVTPPDYRDRQLVLGFPQRLVGSRDRVLLVDDWIDTGGQASGVQRIIHSVGATWIGAAVIVDALESNIMRRELGVRSLLHERDL